MQQQRFQVGRGELRQRLGEPRHARLAFDPPQVPVHGIIVACSARAEDWIWDSWIADDGERYHLFFLRAPRALRDPGLRHEAARIGHASSVDLTHWEVHDDALGAQRRASTTSRCGPARSRAATTAYGGCTTRR